MKKNKKKINDKKKKEDSLREIKMRVVGVGGGGGSIISNISKDLKKILFAAVNTDVHALEEVTRRKKIKGVSFGKKITGGLGTGMDSKMGREAALEDIEEVKNLFKDEDIIILVVSLGGGTGTGALPIFASAARNAGCLVYGVFTLPFSFEGEKKMKLAKEAIKETYPYLHAMTVFPNEKIFEIVDKNTPLKEALMVINKNLARNLEGLVETIYETGLVNIDFADVRTVLENRKGMRKLTYLNTVEGSLEEGTQEIVKRAVSNPLYPYEISRARGVLFNITGGKDIGLTDISAVSESISGHTDDNAKIIIGIMQKNKYKKKIRVSLLATGCDTDFLKKEIGDEPSLGEKSKTEKKEKRSKKKKVSTKKEKEKKIKKKVSTKKEKEKKITVVPFDEKEVFSEEKPKEPKTEEEREILKEEERWEKPSFLKRMR